MTGKLTEAARSIGSILDAKKENEVGLFGDMKSAIDSLSLEEVLKNMSNVAPENWCGCSGGYSTDAFAPLELRIFELSGVKKISVVGNLSDLEYDPNSECIRDFTGPEVDRVYSDVCNKIREYRLKAGWKEPV